MKKKIYLFTLLVLGVCGLRAQYVAPAEGLFRIVNVEYGSALTENYVSNSLLTTQVGGNASSIHSPGREAKRALENARRQVAEAIGAQPNEIYFTGCGSESDNWAIKGTAYALKDKGNHIITTAFEHHAVLASCEALEKEGFEVTYIKPDSDGIISPEDIRNAITITLSLSYAHLKLPAALKPKRSSLGLYDE